jgi:hypothetical protein
MIASWNLHLALGLKALTTSTESMDPVDHKYNYKFRMKRITNMATVRNFEVLSKKLHVENICTTVIGLRYNNNNNKEHSYNYMQ